MKYLDDIAIGDTETIGSYRFSAEEIVDFARRFDPQPFHLSEEGARNSLFGRLCASGWHTAAVWMKLMVAHFERETRAALARGDDLVTVGPSPGFDDMRWLKPVYVDDTITYRNEVIEARPSASRPGWGVLRSRNQGINQHGELVFEFIGTVMWPTRPKR